jgi:hypothetical protein
LIADDMIELATNCERRKDFDRAIAILQRVIGMHTKARGNFENSDVADDYSRIALVQILQEKTEVAISTLLTAIGIRRTPIGARPVGGRADLGAFLRSGGDHVSPRPGDSRARSRIEIARSVDDARRPRILAFRTKEV